jgi:cytochrome oxidase Cu insertion factor (SCO1/SenC/PrrC family)
VFKLKKAEKGAQKVHLVSVSFDPITDTPPVLKNHARELSADLSRWSFLTGDRDDVDQFAARFGFTLDDEARTLCLSMPLDDLPAELAGHVHRRRLLVGRG